MDELSRARPVQTGFNLESRLPYELRLEDFALAMQDVYDLLHDINSALTRRGLKRLEETVRPAIFSGILSDALTAALGRHARVLTENRYHNGHPDLIPQGRYANNRVAAGEDGVEVKATVRGPSVDTHGARDAWLCVFQYKVDMESEPAATRIPTRFRQVWLAQLSRAHFRTNNRGELGTPTASPNQEGVRLLRENRVYREPD